MSMASLSGANDLTSLTSLSNSLFVASAGVPVAVDDFPASEAGLYECERLLVLAVFKVLVFTVLLVVQ